MSKRAKLTAAFIEALEADWQQHGDVIIEKLREDSPTKYAEIVAKLCPAQSQVEISETDGLEEMLSGMTNKERIAWFKGQVAQWEREEAEAEALAQLSVNARVRLTYEQEKQEYKPGAP
jgi:hypothetical protein